MLSELSKVFDPLGLLSPFTVRAKILFQELWKIKVDWDEELPMHFVEQWNDYKDDLQHIRGIRIPRCLIAVDSLISQIHGFSDGSELAYGAAVYLRSEYADGSVVVRLITSKSKVAPLSTISIPRLELCAAVMLANLIDTVKDALNFSGEIITWTDSATVLKWLAACPSRWKTFVANRVAEIQGLIPTDQWHYVHTSENPADLLTRGKSAVELKESTLWWQGPHWLSTDKFPTYSYESVPEEMAKEQKAIKVLTTEVKPHPMLWKRYSNLIQLIRATAWLQRFIQFIKDKQNCRVGPLTSHELQIALHSTVRQVQLQSFSTELNQLMKNDDIKKKSRLLSLAPFVDQQGFLRVGGRLQNAKVAEEIKHPLLLPHNHEFTTLVIRHFHLHNLHAGPKLVHALIQRQFWIVGARNVIRHELHKCIVCRRQNAITSTQFMGNLPSARVNPGFAFQKCGVDYAGPYQIRSPGRGKVQFKYYVSIFICMATKAVHLEPVSSLSTDAFLGTFRCFISRRGRVTDMYSDCGTNFIGADKELKELLASANHNATLGHQLADKNINWHFNPPGAPHQGGLWEAAVKSMKFHLRRVMGAATVTSEEFRTLLCEIEACLNSRPLCPLSSDPSDLQSLTPGHFLMGQPLNAIPEPDLTHIQISRLSRWQLVQQMTQHFWKRWSAEYVTSLQQRSRWTQKQRNLQVGDLVLIKDENQPPTKWTMGRIVTTHPGSDGLVRCATIKTATSEFNRPAAKLCLLLDSDDEETTEQ